MAARTLQRFLEGLPTDASGIRGSGGWAVVPVDGNRCALDIVSGGQDVADGIQAGADALFDAVAATEGIGLSWHQLNSDETIDSAGTGKRLQAPL
ncbi:hypothetical protein [Actinomyces qiguomingii]|uniref:hypothetical protein n=1 Tax=Actinomyces qiguomingii TaxID=2057800 RepID=UPI000CA041CE|nr:hypothetical protein [Actinomyces qiguomingii]